MRRWHLSLSFSSALLACACGGPRIVHETIVRRPRPTAAAPLAQTASARPTLHEAETPSARAERQEKHVAVQGIEGTLSNFDVRVTMEHHSKEFARCHETRARRVPHVAGNIEFKIHVLTSGEVSDVRVHASDLGDRPLERCLSEVIQNAKFPEPHGGEADVAWNMALAPSGRAPAEVWETDRVERIVKKHKSDLLATCDARRAGPFQVTAYVSPSGRVLAAGVAAERSSSAEHFDCIAEELRSWPMPRPRKGVAKVSFSLRS